MTIHTERMKHKKSIPSLLVLLLLVVTACSSIECPVQNKVASCYEINGGVFADTLTVSTLRQDGKDTVLLSYGVGLASFQLPLSFNQPVDVLLFRREQLNVTDTVWVEKDDQPHFESVDCGVTYFHTLKSVRHTKLGIDSIAILKTTVDYDLTASHLRIYFKADS